MWPVFLWKAHIFLPLHSTSNLKMFPLNCIPHFCTQKISTKIIIPVKSCPYDHNTFVTDKQTDRRTDDNRTISSTAGAENARLEFAKLEFAAKTRPKMQGWKILTLDFSSSSSCRNIGRQAFSISVCRCRSLCTHPGKPHILKVFFECCSPDLRRSSWSAFAVVR